MTTLKTYPVFLTFTCDRPSIEKITYTYDSMNRRVARTDEKGTTRYLYGNLNHPFQITAVCDYYGKLIVYHYDDFGLLFAIENHTKLYYVATDQLGTPKVVSDADGEVVKVLEYDSFGNQIFDSNPAFKLDIGFAGGLVDCDTELVRFGFRDYDSASGKWTAKDPIRFAGGDSNLYGYVCNNPVSLVDLVGLEPEVILQGGITYYGGFEALVNQAESRYGKISSSGGKCLTGVQTVLDSVGIHIKRVLHAYQFPEAIKESNFFDYYKEIDKATELKDLPNGSIVVFDRAKNYPSGHIEIKAATPKYPTRFISDYQQFTRTTYHGQGPAHIYVPK